MVVDYTIQLHGRENCAEHGRGKNFVTHPSQGDGRWWGGLLSNDQRQLGDLNTFGCHCSAASRDRGKNKSAWGTGQCTPVAGKLRGVSCGRPEYCLLCLCSLSVTNCWQVYCRVDLSTRTLTRSRRSLRCKSLDTRELPTRCVRWLSRNIESIPWAKTRNQMSLHHQPKHPEITSKKQTRAELLGDCLLRFTRIYHLILRLVMIGTFCDCCTMQPNLYPSRLWNSGNCVKELQYVQMFRPWPVSELNDRSSYAAFSDIPFSIRRAASAHTSLARRSRLKGSGGCRGVHQRDPSMDSPCLNLARKIVRKFTCLHDGPATFPSPEKSANLSLFPCTLWHISTQNLDFHGVVAKKRFVEWWRAYFELRRLIFIEEVLTSPLTATFLHTPKHEVASAWVMQSW